MLPLAVQATMASIEKICPEARNLLIIPENHNRNPSYLASLAQLQRIFKMSGLNVRLGSISPDVKKPVEINLPTRPKRGAGAGGAHQAPLGGEAL